jgi:serine/threonine protein kinase
LDYSNKKLLAAVCSVCSAEPGAEDLVACRHSPVFTNDPLLGTNVGDRYEIVQVIGIGGYSTVYEAKDNVLNRLVAIKILHSQHSVDQQKLLRFQREAQSASLISHANIAAIYDFGSLPQGRPYIVMELVSGRTLDLMIKQGHRFSGKEFVDVFSQLCDGLEAAHKIGLIHRDLKPSNIIITDEGMAKALDFGIAKWALQEAADLTKSDELVGTPSYMSPEQCLGTALDKRADIYALACVMYEAISGTKAFPGDKALECMHRQLKVMPTRFSSISPRIDVPLSLESAIFKALAKEPASRFQSMAELKSALATCYQKATVLKFVRDLLIFSPIRKRGVLLILIVILAGSLLAYIFLTPQKSKTIEFPNRQVGVLYLIRRDESGKTIDATKFAIAQGSVSVPKNSLVKLTEIPTEEASLDWLSRLKSNDLQVLDLSALPISNKSLANVAKLRDLQSLNVDGTDVTDEGFKQLALPKLGGLDLSDTRVTSHVLDYISALMKRIDWLSLRGTDITDGGLLSLSNLRYLVTLNLSNTKLTDAGLAQIEELRLPRLSQIDVAQDEITNSGVIFLSKITTLRTLNLNGTKITDQAVDALSQMPRLEQLDVSKTSLSTAAVSRLRKELPRCDILANDH